MPGWNLNRSVRVFLFIVSFYICAAQSGLSMYIRKMIDIF